jgi:hypothetical protein
VLEPLHPLCVLNDALVEENSDQTAQPLVLWTPVYQAQEKCKKLTKSKVDLNHFQNT